METLVFDSQALEEWKQVDEANWPKVVGEILQLFLSTAKERQAALLEAWQKGELQKMGQRAHALKSSCGSVGAMRAHVLLAEMEACCMRQDKVRLYRLMQEFDPVFDESLTQIATYFGEIKRR